MWPVPFIVQMKSEQANNGRVISIQVCGIDSEEKQSQNRSLHNQAKYLFRPNQYY